MGRRVRRAVRAAATAFLFPCGLVGQQTGTIEGTVAEVSSGRSLAGVQVLVQGTAYGAITNAEGRFAIANVAPGTYRVRASLIGYGPEVNEVTLGGGETVTTVFRLAFSAVALDELVVTVTGERRKREIGNAVARIQADQLVETAPVGDLSELLRGRTAGVQLLTSSGATGMGSRIRVRGASSISLSNEPLIYVDGVRVQTGPTLSVFVGGQQPSRLDDINPEDIESIEIVKGPAATTLYGTEAANGVIRITTKRGRPGQTRWNVWTEAGLVKDPGGYPLNWAGLDDNGGFYAQRCLLEFEASGQCTQTGVRTYQVLEDPNLSPLATGSRRQLGASVSGGSQQVSYYLSAEHEREIGPFKLPAQYRDTLLARGIPVDGTVERPQQLERLNMRANLTTQVSPHTTLSARLGYTGSDLSIMPGDNHRDGVVWSAMAGGTDPDDPSRAWGFRTPAESFGQSLSQEVDRFITGASIQSAPRSWVDLRATVGLDFVSRADVSFIPRNLGVPGQADLGTRNVNRFSDYRYTLDAGATLRRALTPRVKSETSIGIQYFRTVFKGTLTSGEDIVTGSSSIGAAAETSGSEIYSEDKTLGLFVEQQVNVDERLFLTAGLRADDNSAFGRDYNLVYYPKLALSWVASEESFFPEIPFLDELRLRGAWGQSGLQPGSTAALTTLNALPVTDGLDQTVSGVTIGAAGNNLLEPERSSEIEVGLDLDLMGGRLGTELTFYRKTTDGALVQVPLPPSLGSASTRWANVGDVLNRGFEAAVKMTPVDGERLRWDMRLSGSTNHNELLTLGENVQRIGAVGPSFVPGYPLGGTWGYAILGFSDADGDGILRPSEITVADTLVFNGSTLPTRELSAASTFTLFSNLQVYALVEYRGGFKAGNGTELFHCNFRRCRGLVDRTAPLEEQAAAVAAVYHDRHTLSGYGEDGSYVRLREASLTYAVPQAVAARLGVERLSVTLAGRNLKTWTGFTGLDPEGNFTGQANFGQSEFLTQPPPRYWTLRFRVGF